MGTLFVQARRNTKSTALHMQLPLGWAGSLQGASPHPLSCRELLLELEGFKGLSAQNILWFSERNFREKGEASCHFSWIGEQISPVPGGRMIPPEWQLRGAWLLSLASERKAFVPWVVAPVRMLCGLLEKSSDTTGTTASGEEAASPALLSLGVTEKGEGGKVTVCSGGLFSSSCWGQ